MNRYFAIMLTMDVIEICLLGNKMEEIFIVKKFLRAIPLRFMQIITSIEKFDDFNNMSIEEVVGHLKVH